MNIDDYIYAFLLLYYLNNENTYSYVDYGDADKYILLLRMEILNYILNNKIEKAINLASTSYSNYKFETIELTCINEPIDPFYRFSFYSSSNDNKFMLGIYKMKVNNADILCNSSTKDYEYTLHFNNWFKAYSPFFPLRHYSEYDPFKTSDDYVVKQWDSNNNIILSDKEFPVIIDILKSIKSKLKISNLINIYKFVIEHNKHFNQLKKMYILNLYDLPRSVIYLNMLNMFHVFFKYIMYIGYNDIKFDDIYNRFKKIIFNKIKKDIQYIYVLKFLNVKKIINNKLVHNLNEKFNKFILDYMVNEDYDISFFFGVKKKKLNIDKRLLVNKLYNDTAYVHQIVLSEYNGTIEEMLVDAYKSTIDMYNNKEHDLNYTFIYNKQFYLVEEDIIPKMQLDGNTIITKIDIKNENKISYPVYIDMNKIDYKYYNNLCKYVFAKYFNKGDLYGRY